MATVKPILDTYTDKDGCSALYVLVRHRTERKKLSVEFKIPRKYWKGDKVSSAHEEAEIINAKISEIVSEVKKYFADCKLHKKPIQISVLGSGFNSYSFIGYLQARVNHYREKNSPVQARKLTRYVLDLTECHGGEVFFEHITMDFLRKYEAYLIKKKNKTNTRKQKFDRLRQFYGNAITEGKVAGINPFENYHIAKIPTKKKKLTEDEIAIMEKATIQSSAVSDARNLFLFSYYCKGARFENCVMMLKSAIANGRIEWRINKGKRLLSVKLHAKLHAILDQYKDNPGPFIFPFAQELWEHPAYKAVLKAYVDANGDVSEGKEDAYNKMIDVLNVTVNRLLAEVCRQCEIPKVTFHIARHTFAHHMKKRTDKISVIQESLGHKDQKTTELYLDSLDDEHIDEEMRKLYGD